MTISKLEKKDFPTLDMQSRIGIQMKCWQAVLTNGQLVTSVYVERKNETLANHFRSNEALEELYKLADSVT